MNARLRKRLEEEFARDPKGPARRREYGELLVARGARVVDELRHLGEVLAEFAEDVEAGQMDKGQYYHAQEHDRECRRVLYDLMTDDNGHIDETVVVTQERWDAVLDRKSIQQPQDGFYFTPKF